MIRRGNGGAIVNVSSYSARNGGGGVHIDYAAMKAGIDCITIGFARELGDQGIRVNAISPGTINTPRTLRLLGDQREKREKRIALKRLGEPLEVTEAVLWLLSSKASYVTGAILSVAGGGP
jgi:NAD(P)-dependent dehydrogenase (short-subunit alcohol dehydrogenase family)